MKPNALVLALLTAATTMPVSARAADDLCSRIFIYAINQICQLLPNGQTLCQPIGLAGAGPNCESPSGGPQLVQIPLGPPAIQMSPFAAANPYAPNPYASNPFASAPYAPNPYATNPIAGNTYPPFPFAPNLFGPNPFAPNQNAPVTAQLPPRAPAGTPPSLPVPPIAQLPLTPPPVKQLPTVQPPVPPAVVVAPVPPTIVAEPAATAPAEKPLVKLMPETLPTDTAAVVARATPSAPVAEAAPVAPEPLKPAAASQADQAPVAAPIAAASTLAVSEKPKSEIVAVAPATAPTPSPENAAPVTAPIPVAAPSAIMPAQPEDKEAAAKAETDRLQAEKALEDALAHFEFDSAELTPVGRAMLDAWLVQAPGDAPIVVTGHADRLGPEPYNDKLSMLRAEAVKKYLTEKGKPANRIQILAKGEAMPLISCNGDATPETKACLAPNRRAEVAAKPASKIVAKTVAKSATKNVRKNAKPAKPAKSKSTR